ncbi:tRNA (N6-threonylcarbamoyladenosine(37)-N6)-methyltransferase TrmO [Bacillus sp. 03113]|uniref:tRNA (N6-threonylcarbamoyladenosine(37)-N6)-methyltransferase TrmO n=1 Tax=Bacillus sp. 03113 TaxID=2578211 RepID=UPI00114187CF|nr:tRNA (N6-threonylcarbamoyladenosine(37)-N6)-methyltransferase TrmO [Bacillus sp. 03113]
MNLLPEITLSPIGVIRSPFITPDNMPIQPVGDMAASGSVEVLPQYVEGLKDLEGFSHVILIYFFHLAGPTRLKVRPFLDVQERGVFATRAPVRPNSIGISVVEVERIHGCYIDLKKVDVLDGTPLLDIKPFVPDFDVPKGAVLTGWMGEVSEKAIHKRADDRFARKMPD